MRRWSSLHRSTQLAAATGAALALILLGPVAVAVVMLRCCDDARGPGIAARIVVGLVVLVIAIGVGTASGALVELVRRSLSRYRAGRSG